VEAEDIIVMPMVQFSIGGGEENPVVPACYKFVRVMKPSCPGPEPTPPAPEFPSTIFPVTFVIGILGAMFLIRSPENTDFFLAKSYFYRYIISFSVHHVPSG
jgi:hypothetical protein